MSSKTKATYAYHNNVNAMSSQMAHRYSMPRPHIWLITRWKQPKMTMVIVTLITLMPCHACIRSSLFHDCAGVWQVRMAEIVQTCTLLVTGRLEEVLDPVQQSRKYPAVQLDRLSAVLTKFRCAHAVVQYTMVSLTAPCAPCAAAFWRHVFPQSCCSLLLPNA